MGWFPRLTIVNIVTTNTFFNFVPLIYCVCLYLRRSDESLQKSLFSFYHSTFGHTTKVIVASAAQPSCQPKIYLCVYISVCVSTYTHAYTCIDGDKKKVAGSLELELQAFMKYVTGAPGSESQALQFYSLCDTFPSLHYEFQCISLSLHFSFQFLRVCA